MIKIKWTLDTGFGPSCRHSGEIEVGDDATVSEIDDAVAEEVHQCLDWWWEKDDA